MLCTALRSSRCRLIFPCFSTCSSTFGEPAAYILPVMSSGRLETPHFKRILTPDLLRIEQLFKSEGYSLRLVGGVVRDLLLEQKAKDIDLATDCTPEEMVKLFEREGLRHIPTGIEHGTITVHTDQANDFEITTLRIDHVTDGRHALVQFTSDWVKDAERRDLTINAMSLGFDGVLYDYFDGQRHLAEKILFVGDAVSRIQEDYLRILRYFRFYGRICPLPDAHDPDTLMAIRDNAPGLAKISVERIWSEMRRILIGNHSPHLVALMYELGVATHIGLPPNNDNLHELRRVWEAMHDHYQLEPVCLLVALLRSGDEAEQFSRQWKLSNAERKLGIFIANEREKCYEDVPLKYYQDLLVDGELKMHVLELLKYCNRFTESTELETWPAPQCPVNGRDLLTAGVPSGVSVGNTLKEMRKKWKESYYSMTKEELLATINK